MAQEDRDDLVPDPQVGRELGIGRMALWRWSHDTALRFPKLIKIRNRNYPQPEGARAVQAADDSETEATPDGSLPRLRRYTRIGRLPAPAGTELQWRAAVGNDHSRDYHLLRKIRLRHRGGPSDPTISALLDDQLDESIRHAADALHATPRSGPRKWLVALIAEKNRRARRR